MQFAKKNNYLLSNNTNIRNKHLKMQYDICNLFRNKNNIFYNYLLTVVISSLLTVTSLAAQKDARKARFTIYFNCK